MNKLISVKFKFVRLAMTDCVSWTLSQLKVFFVVNAGTTAAAGATVFLVAADFRGQQKRYLRHCGARLPTGPLGVLIV